MQDAALIGIHGLQRYTAARLDGAVGHAVGQADQRLLAAGAIALGIQGDAGVFAAALVHLQAGQVLQRIQSLAAAANQHALLVAHHIDAHIALFIGIDGHGHLHAHQLGQLLQEGLRAAGSRFRIGLLGRLHGLLGLLGLLRTGLLFGGLAGRLLGRFGLLGLGRIVLRGLFSSLLGGGRLLFNRLGLSRLFLRGLGRRFRLRLAGRLLFRSGLLFLQGIGKQRMGIQHAALLNHGQAHAPGTAAEQAEQALAAFFHYVYVYFANRQAQGFQAGVNCFFTGFAGSFIGFAHYLTFPSPSVSAFSLASFFSRYLLIQIDCAVANMLMVTQYRAKPALLLKQMNTEKIGKKYFIKAFMLPFCWLFCC